MNALTVTIRLSISPFKSVCLFYVFQGALLSGAQMFIIFMSFRQTVLLKILLVVVLFVCVNERDRESNRQGTCVCHKQVYGGQKTTFWSWVSLFSVDSRIKLKSSDMFSEYCYSVSLHSGLRLPYHYIMPFYIPSNSV